MIIEPFTTAAIIGGLWRVTTKVAETLAGEVAGGRADALVHENWQRLRENLKLYRPDANHDLHKAIYRAYLQATLQVCALRLEERGEDTDAWFRRELLPNLLSNVLKRFHRESFVRLDLNSEPRWLKAVSLDLLQKIRALDEDNPPLPTSGSNEEFDSLLKEYDLLLQPEGGAEREKKLREELIKRVISEINQTYGAGTPAFEKLLRERWFELLCACFQYQLKHNQTVANIFVGKLLAGLSVANRQGQQEIVAFAQVEKHFEALGGEMVTRLEQAQTWLRKEQREGFERVEGLVNDALFLILAIGREEATRIEMLEVIISSGFERLSKEMKVHTDHLDVKITGAEVKIIEAIQNQALSISFSAPHQLPRAPDDFVGRHQQIEALKATLGSGGICSIYGMGGVGKTALAVNVAAQLSSGDARPFDRGFFVEMRGTDETPRDPAELLKQFIRPFIGLDANLPDDLEELKNTYKSILSGKRALILLDNAASHTQVLPLLPPTGCTLLVTTREKMALPGLKLTFQLAPLTPEKEPGKARELLLSIASRVALETAERICQLCGYLPLAIRAAGSYLLVYDDVEPEDYEKELGEERTRLGTIGTEGVDVSVEALFSLSYRKLDPEAARVFLQLAVFPASFDGAAEEFICNDSGHKHLSGLVRRSLVQYDETEKRYSLHDLVRIFANSRVSEARYDDERTAAQRRHAIYYQAVLSAVDDLYLKGGGAIAQGLLLFNRELSNIQAGQGWAASRADSDDEAAQLCIGYPDAGAYVLSLRQHSRERIRWLETALSAARRLKQQNAEGNALGNLGNAYFNLGETREAIKYYEQALVISHQIGHRREQSNWLGSLGNAYADLGEGEAIEYYKQALAIVREIGYRRGEGMHLGNLGSAYLNLGETRKAIEYYEQALPIAHEIKDRRGEGWDLGNLGTAYFKLGEIPKAIKYYEQALVISREIGGRGGEGHWLGNLGLAYAGLGDKNKAIELMEAALKIFEEIESPNAAQLRQWLTELGGE